PQTGPGCHRRHVPTKQLTGAVGAESKQGKLGAGNCVRAVPDEFAERRMAREGYAVAPGIMGEARVARAGPWKKPRAAAGGNPPRLAPTGKVWRVLREACDRVEAIHRFQCGSDGITESTAGLRRDKRLVKPFALKPSALPVEREVVQRAGKRVAEAD